MSAWVTEACRRVSNAELLYATVPTELATDVARDDRITLCARPAGRPAGFRPTRSTLVCELSEVELDRKRRALARHASQTGELAAMMGEDTFRRSWRTEWFRRPSEQELSTCALCMTAHQARPTGPTGRAPRRYGRRTLGRPRLV